MASKDTLMWRQYKATGNIKVRQTILERYLPLVKCVAGRMALRLPNMVSQNDLVGWGVLGLVDAVEKFDPNQDIKFETYATFRIRGAILDQLRGLDWAPRALRHEAKKMSEAEERLAARLGRRPSHEEVAEELGMDIVKFRTVRREVEEINLVSLDSCLVQEESEGMNLGKITSSCEILSPDEAAVRHEKEEALVGAIQSLREQERKVIYLYYYEELTLKEIAHLMNLSESRVCQINRKAISSLKRVLSR